MNPNNKRIAKNTLMLYFRMGLIMLVTLYTSRVVLEVLGVEDFGIYNVVGGIVVMFGFLNSAMSSATQRFLSFELGRKDYEQLKKVFSLSVTIHALIAIAIFILAETIGLWLLNNKLTIPAERMDAANWVYQFSIFAFMVNVLAVPYNAAIVSHERMNVYAYVSIIEVILKLAIVFVLQWFGFDKLKLYAILVFVVSFLIQLTYLMYCKKQFKECSCKFIWDKNKFTEILNYVSWTLFGGLASVGLDQGINMLLNIFFGPTINAARSIAYQVSAAISLLHNNMQTAINPQLIKNYAENDYDCMLSLGFKSSRLSFCLMLLVSIPILFHTTFLLKIWLKIVPESTVIFTQLVVVNTLIHTLSGPLITIALASGKIKLFQSVVGSLLLANIPISYVFLLLGYSANIVFIIMIVISILALIARLIILHTTVKFPIKLFCKEVLVRVTTVSIASVSFSFLSSHLIYGHTWLSTIILLSLNILVTLFSVLLWGLTANERKVLEIKAKQYKQLLINN